MPKRKDHILYKIKDNGVFCGYLLGTMHVRDKRAFGHLDMIENCIDSCDVFYAETDINDMYKLAQEGLMNFKNGDHIRNYFKPKKYRKMCKIALKAFDVSLEDVGHLLPMSILNLITLKVLSDDMNLPLDHHLWEYATSSSKQLRGLESAEEQKNIFLQISLEWQLKQFKDTMRRVKAFRKGIIQMANWYQDGQLTKLYRAGKKQLGGMRGLMLYDRNMRMANRAAEGLKEATCFISVGAAHLPGKNGMLKLLNKNGFTTSPVGIKTKYKNEVI